MSIVAIQAHARCMEVSDVLRQPSSRVECIDVAA